MPNRRAVAKPGVECPKCGQIHTRCMGHRESDGSPCTIWPIHGHAVCWRHGAASPQAKARAARVQAQAAAEAAVRTYGLRVDVDPFEAILDEIAWTNGHVQWLREKVQSLSDDDLVWGVAEETEKLASEFPGTDTFRKATPNVWLTLYQAERKHLVDVCATAAKLGIEDRRVKLAERLGGMVVEFANRLFGDPELGLTPEQREVGRHVAARHLRLLSAANE